MSTFRNLMMKSKNRKDVDAWILDYIESTGSQYIDLGKEVSASARIEITARANNDTVNSRLWGNQSSSSDRRTITTYGSGGATKKWLSTSYREVYSPTPINTTKNQNLIADYVNMKFIVDGADAAYPTPFSGTLDTSYLFAIIGGGVTTLKPNFNGSVASYKHFENDQLVQHLFPVKQLDGTVCMWDKVSNTYKLNIGTDEFIAGDTVGYIRDGKAYNMDGTPYGWVAKKLSYIESTGTQAIMTDFVLAQNTGTSEVKFACTGSLVATQGLYGFMTSATTQRISYGVYSNGLFVGQGETVGIGTPELNKIETITWDRYASKAWRDGEEYQLSRSLVTTKLPASIFNRTKAIGELQSTFFTGRVYNINEYDADLTKVLDCHAIEKDGMVGVYDAVNDNYFYKYDESMDDFIGGEQDGWILADGSIVDMNNDFLAEYNILSHYSQDSDFSFGLLFGGNFVESPYPSTSVVVSFPSIPTMDGEVVVAGNDSGTFITVGFDSDSGKLSVKHRSSETILTDVVVAPNTDYKIELWNNNTTYVTINDEEVFKKTNDHFTGGITYKGKIGDTRINYTDFFGEDPNSDIKRNVILKPIENAQSTSTLCRWGDFKNGLFKVYDGLGKLYTKAPDATVIGIVNTNGDVIYNTNE